MLEPTAQQPPEIGLRLVAIRVDRHVGAARMVEAAPGADEGDLAPEGRLPGQDLDAGAITARIEADQPQRLDEVKPGLDPVIKRAVAHWLTSPVGAALGLAFLAQGQMRLRSAGLVCSRTGRKKTPPGVRRRLPSTTGKPPAPRPPARA
jgi:hypothetical protein